MGFSNLRYSEFSPKPATIAFHRCDAKPVLFPLIKFKASRARVLGSECLITIISKIIEHCSQSRYILILANGAKVSTSSNARYSFALFVTLERFVVLVRAYRRTNWYFRASASTIRQTSFDKVAESGCTQPCSRRGTSMRAYFIVGAAILALSSCTDMNESVWVRKTAADAALPGAYSVRLITPEELQPGKIYAVRGGSYIEICSNDLEMQTALKKITVEAGKKSADTVSDQARFTSAEINAFGIKLGPSYQIRKVTGFQIFRAKATGANAGLASYILANVRKDGPKTCGGGILKENRPYLVVEATVVADRVDITNKAKAAWEGAIGGLGGSIGVQDAADDTRTNVVFGAKGLLVPK